MTTALRSHLSELAAGLGEDELVVLVDVAERLTLGRRVYGPLRVATDSRNWVREASEEAFDLAVYASVLLRTIERLTRHAYADTLPHPPPDTHPNLEEAP